MVAEGLTPLHNFTAEALDDAFALDMAMGGSTNTVLQWAGNRQRSRAGLFAAAHQ